MAAGKKLKGWVQDTALLGCSFLRRKVANARVSRESPACSMSEGVGMLTNYSCWMGKPVVMNIVNGNVRVPLYCTVVNECDGRVRVRIKDKWDVDIYKDMIGSVEADTGSAQAQLVSFET